MNQEQVNPSTINLRSKGISNSHGRVHKGCVKDATTKLSVGSIPSTYESIIYKIENKRAFGTSEKRFFNKSIANSFQNSNYQDNSTIESYQSQTKVDHNKVGQNCFISKQKRQCFRTIKTPAPNQYYKDQNKNQVRERKCMTRQSKKYDEDIRNFVQRKKKNEEQNLPGPGEYIFDKKQEWNSPNKGWKSSFNTKVRRDKYIPQSITPGPGYYRFTQILNSKQNDEKQPFEERQASKDTVLMQIFQEQKEGYHPGPWSYNQQIPSFKPLYQRIKMSSNFMTPIYSKKLKNKGLPTATTYKVKRMYDELQPKLLESTCFMSETKRQVFENAKTNLGPNMKIPSLVGQKNFHFNIKNDWIC